MSSNNNFRAGVDWGSSSFRAYRFDSSGTVDERITTNQGIKTVSSNQFEDVLFNHIENWVNPGDCVLISGMITSRNGWLETPYIVCPATPAHEQAKLTERQLRGIRLLFMPGLCQRAPDLDVMRGEELQLLGANALRSESQQHNSQPQIVVLPGTHSKWALIDGSTVVAFNTIATGELFDSITQHTLIGALVDLSAWNDNAFRSGVVDGHTTQSIISDLFAARANVLLNYQSPVEAHAYLSGLLIGNEIKEGQIFCSKSTGMRTKAISIVGSDSLCRLYTTAAQICGIKASITEADATEAGYALIARNLL